MAGWHRSLRKLLEQCRGISMEDVFEGLHLFLERCLTYRLARYIWYSLAIVIFHAKLLHAVTFPIHGFLTKGQKGRVFSDGSFYLPRFTFHRIRGEVAVALLTLSALWHCFTFPNPMTMLRWCFTVRPQVNLKPQMSMITKSHSTPQVTSKDDVALTRSVSDSQISFGGKIDAGLDLRLTNEIVDPFLTAVDNLSDSLSLASEFAASNFGELGSRSSAISADSQSIGSFWSIEDIDETDDGEKMLEDFENNNELKLAPSKTTSNKECQTLTERHSVKKVNQSQSGKRIKLGPVKWFTWKLPAVLKLRNGSEYEGSDSC